MKKKSTSQSGFLNPRAIIGVLSLVGAFLALFEFHAFAGASAQAAPAERTDGASQSAASDGPISRELPPTVATVTLPEVAVDQSMSNFVAPVKTSAIDAKSKLVGFQGDFTFDERVVTFQSPPVQKAGLTGGNWNVSGNVMSGTGPIRTVRISAFANDLAAISGSGTLFELRMTRVSKATQGTPLTWAARPNHFLFIDADLNTQKPQKAESGSVTQSGKRK